MYSTKDLTVEIESVVAGLRADCSDRLHPAWITQTIMQRHADIAGSDTEFFLCMARAQVREAVARCLNRYKAKPEVDPDPQLVLPGFARLQAYYLVNEDDTQIAVRIESMSVDQLRAKKAELEAMGAGCYEHAREIDRYIEAFHHPQEAA